ncbi:putative ribonuclease H-like domain-containing protein, partial [Tanacetum coccineum]
MHITFLENKPKVVRSGPDWLFDIDLLTNSMNYKLVTAGNQTSKNAGIKDNVDAVPTQQYILLPLLYNNLQSLEDAVADEACKKTNEKPANEGEINGQEKEGGASNKEDDQNVQDFRAALDNLLVQQKKGYANSINRDSTDTGIFSGAYNDEDVGAEADLNNLETTMNRLVDFPKGKHAIGTKWVYRNKKDERGIVVRNKARLVAQGYTQEEGIDYDKVFAHVARIEAIRLFLAYASFIGFIVYQMDVKSAFLYGTIEEEVPEPGMETSLHKFIEIRGFRRGIIDKTLFIKKEKGDILLVQVLQVMQKDGGIFISQDKYVADILKKF